MAKPVILNESLALDDSGFAEKVDSLCGYQDPNSVPLAEIKVIKSEPDDLMN